MPKPLFAESHETARFSVYMTLGFLTGHEAVLRETPRFYDLRKWIFRAKAGANANATCHVCQCGCPNWAIRRAVFMNATRRFCALSMPKQPISLDHSAKAKHIVHIINKLQNPRKTPFFSASAQLGPKEALLSKTKKIRK